MAQDRSAAAALSRVAEAFWRQLREQDLYVAIAAGEPPRHLPIVSQDRCDASADAARRLLDALEDIDAASLAADDRVTRDVLVWEQRQRIDAARYCWLQPLLTPYASVVGAAQNVFRRHRLDSRADLAGYRRLLGECPRFITSIDAFVRGQAERGIVLPREELDVVIALLDAYLTPPTQNALYVTDDRLARHDAKTAKVFQRQVASLIARRIDPATRRLRDYLAGPYRARAPQTLGLHQYPQGKDYYRHLVRFHTTLDLTPEAVHARGLAAVETLEAQMRDLRAQLGFGGRDDDFRAHLRDDRRFYARDPAEVEARLMAAVGRVAASYDRYFATTPRTPYGVGRLDPGLEASMTYGYYELPSAQQPKGLYRYNASALDRRSMLEMPATVLHELMPGHHLQISLQMENDKLPPFRRLGAYSAYMEGWATYASYLGVEMGAYPDPYDRYGQLSADLAMAVRLVVDTGINYYGWTQARTEDYMRTRLPLSETEIRSEVLRYAVDMPGQALAYRIGEEELLRLRARAEAAGAFDPRRFHRCVLDVGAIPLAVLDRHVAACLATAE